MRLQVVSSPDDFTQMCTWTVLWISKPVVSRRLGTRLRGRPHRSSSCRAACNLATVTRSKTFSQRNGVVKKWRTYFVRIGAALTTKLTTYRLDVLGRRWTMDYQES